MSVRTEDTGGCQCRTEDTGGCQCRNCLHILIAA